MKVICTLSRMNIYIYIYMQKRTKQNSISICCYHIYFAYIPYRTNEDIFIYLVFYCEACTTKITDCCCACEIRVRSQKRSHSGIPAFCILHSGIPGIPGIHYHRLVKKNWHTAYTPVTMLMLIY